MIRKGSTKDELGDEDQEQKNEGKAEADTEAFERLVHAVDHAAQIHANVGRQFGVRDGLADPGRQFAQILSDRRDVHICHALELVMIDFGRRFKIHEFDHGVERGRLFEIGSAQGNFLQVYRIMNGALPCSAYWTERK